MRNVMVSAAFACIAMMAGTAPASANWSCVGPEYVCGPSKATYTTSYSKPSKKHGKVAYKSSKKKSYSASYVSGGSYSGKASYYWQGQRTASGARFNPDGMTAAHRTLPFGTKVRVTNRVNGKSVVVTINDRGPFIGGRIIDLSRGAARAISMTGMGVAPVQLAVLGRG